MKNSLFLVVLFLCSFDIYSQVGVNTTSPTATLHVYGSTTLPSGGGTVNLLNQNFNSAYTVVHSNNAMSGCAAPATNGWERTLAGNVNANCTSCTGGWLYIYSDETGCLQNATARIDLTSAPTSTTIAISFSYRYNNFGATGDTFRAYLYNNTTNSQVGANLVGLLTTDANTTYSGSATVVAGNSYSLRFEYIGDFDYGASIDNVLVTETSAPTGGNFTFRLEDGTQGAGKVLTSDANGNGYWQTASGGSGTDSQTLSIAGNTLSISNGNSVTLPSGTGTYTFTNGLTNTSGTVRLGGTLTQATTLNLDSYDLNFNSSTSAAFPGQIKFNGTNRVIMETNFDEDYISFGGGSTIVDADDGLTFLDSGGDTYTRDFALGFYKGAAGGSAMATGSIEYIVDGLDELLLEASSLNPLVDNDTRLGGSSKRWTAVWATNGTIQTSDMKLKKDVVELKYGLKEVMQLNPISYKWKNNSIGKTAIPDQLQETKLGFSAQQLLDVLPEVVETHSWYPKDEEGNFERKQNENLGVRYAEITPVIVKAIQEQQEQIESLKVTVEELKKQNEILLKLLEKK
ncbi:MAG: tail fiber domain-containing protein [Flavobacterium sp.]